MAFDFPTLRQIRDRAKSDIVSTFNGVSAVLRKGPLDAIAKALAGLSQMMFGFFRYLEIQMFITTARGDGLDRFGDIYGITRRIAAKSFGEVTVTGSSAQTIVTGAVLSRQNGARYEVTENSILVETPPSSGSFEAVVNISALVGGEDGNADTGTILSFESPQIDVDTDTVVVSLTGGIDEEEDDSYRSRLLERIQTPPQGGSDADYRVWVREVTLPSRIFILPNRLGFGTVGVTFVFDSRNDIRPTNAEIEAVQENIEERRPVTANVFVFSPNVLEVDVEIQLNPNSTAAKLAVEKELSRAFLRSGSFETNFPTSKIREAISIAPGENDHVLVSPTGDFVPVGAGEIPVLGEVTYS